MIVINGVIYYTAKDAANYLGINRSMFYTNVKDKLNPFRLGVRKRWHYKQQELDKFLVVQPKSEVELSLSA